MLALTAQQPKAFEFQEGDRMVLLGGTVVEREQRFGSLETALQLALPEKALTLRNLAWSGDTVFGDARSYFGPPAEGLTRLGAQLELTKPTVVLCCYGADLAHAGLGKLPDFLSGYRALLDMIREKAPNVRIVLATPPPLETLAPPLPDQTGANKNLSQLRDAVRKLAAMQNAYFIDWFESMGGMPKAGVATHPLTENGMHYQAEGYQKLAAATLAALGVKPADVAATATDALRSAVVAKDTMFFNRWRPQNETYLFGFRKHEQGQNAKEIPMFDPLIAEADQKVQAAKNQALAAATRP
jgi:lysophospholipase L1-like esterase